MHKLGHSACFFLFGLVSLIMAGQPPVMAAQLSPSMSVDGSFVSWLPPAEYKQAILRVGGPTGNLTRTFLPGEVPSFDLADIDGPVDGLYTFEMTFLVPQDAPGSIPETVAETIFLRASEGRFLVSKPEEPTPAFEAGEPSGDGEALRNLSAELAFNENLSVIGRACIGVDCTANEDFGSETLRLKGEVVRLAFDDTDSPLFPNNDWQLTLNDSGFGSANRFSIDDVTGSTTPFTLLAGAPDNSLFVDSGGKVGMGTSVPDTSLHIRRTDGSASLTIEEASTTPQGRVLLEITNNGAARFQLTDTSHEQAWQITNGDSVFKVVDATGNLVPFTLLSGAPDHSLFVDADGDVGIGTSAPGTSMHVRRADGSAKVTVEEASAVANGRVLYELINNGAVRFNMVDTSLNQTWRFTNGATRFRIIDTSDLEVVEFDLSTDGDLTLAGEIFTNGTCSIGCDRVFADDYDLESIEEHAELMWTNSHLPGVGPTPESGQVNLSQKTLGILNELEKAHIYIEQLHETLEDVQSAMARQTAELEALKQVVHGPAGPRSRP